MSTEEHLEKPIESQENKNEKTEEKKEEIEEKVNLLSKINKTLSPLSSSITITCLILISILSFLIRIFSIIRYEIIIHEYDPWFNYRVTEYLSEKGIYSLLDWYDPESWYPLGRIIGGTLYPGLMFTSYIIFKLLNFLLFPINIINVCVFLPPFFSVLSSIATFFLTKEITGRKECALLSSFFISIIPGYISRSVAGDYDNEAVSITAMIITFYFFIKSINSGSIFYSILTSFTYFYMVSSWGGYVFITNLIPLYILFLIFIGRTNIKIYTSYSIFYVLGNALAMQIPFVGTLIFKSSEHFLSHGVFIILNCVIFIKFLKKIVKKEENIERLFKLLFFFVIIFCGLSFLLLTFKGYIHFGERIMTLLDPTYASKYIPIVASVAEHNPTTWTDFYYDLHYLLIFSPLGFYYCFSDPTNSKLFIAIFSLCSIYFSSVMIRLLLLSSPALCILSAIGISDLLHSLIKNNKSKNSKYSLIEIILISLLISYICFIFIIHSTYASAESYSDNEIIEISTNDEGEKKIMDELREAYYWLRMNTPENAKIASWWDYGYQIAGMSHRAVLVDNNTWNTSHIATVGAILALDEEESFKICKNLDADYVLIIFGGANGNGDDDINKFLWMVNIASGYYSNIKESYYIGDEGFVINKNAAQQFMDSMIYKFSYYRFWEFDFNIKDSEYDLKGYDAVREDWIGYTHFNLEFFEEVYTTTNWNVRIYKVKDFPNREFKMESRFKQKNPIFINKIFLRKPNNF